MYVNISGAVARSPKPSTLPWTSQVLNPKPQTKKPETPNQKILNPKPQNPKPQTYALHPKPKKEPRPAPFTKPCALEITPISELSASSS